MSGAPTFTGGHYASMSGNCVKRQPASAAHESTVAPDPLPTFRQTPSTAALQLNETMGRTMPALNR